MSLLTPIGAVALLALPAILLMYFLKARRPAVRVATLMLWGLDRADLHANAARQRFRAGLLLMIQLLAALALALALTRPGISSAAGVASITVVILDGSASMEATDVAPSRWDVARARARALIQQLKPGQEMALILLSGHAQLLAAPTLDASTLDAALDRSQPSGQAGDLAEGISLANALLAEHTVGSIVLLSDGHWQPVPTPLRIVAPLTYVQIGTTGENVGIAALSLSGSGSVFIGLTNYGRIPRNLNVELRADGRVVDVLPAHVDAESTTDLTWTRLPLDSQVLQVRLVPNDVFALDDTAWLITAPSPRRQVLLVTTENGFLSRALELLPGVDLTVVDPRNYKVGAFDLYVFDGFVPPGKLPAPALLVAPPQGEGPAPVGSPIDPGSVLPADSGDPLLRDVVLSNVHIQVANRAQPPAGWRTIISAAGGPLLMVHESYPRVAELTFDVHHSDLPLRPAFPILIQNLFSFLSPGSFENQLLPLGQPVALTAEPNARSLSITSPNGRVTKLAPPFPPYTDTVQPGVYTVRQFLPSGIRVSRFVIQLQDPSLANILPGPAPQTQESVGRAGPAATAVGELWPLLAAAGLVLIVAEWFLFLRESFGAPFFSAAVHSGGSSFRGRKIPGFKRQQRSQM